MAHEKYPQVLPEKFDGSGNFDDWVSNFECISAINGWNEREMALWLRAHVTGKAHVAYKCFSHEIQENFTQTKAALRERFEPSSKQKKESNSKGERNKMQRIGLILGMICCHWLIELFRTFRNKQESSWPSCVFSRSYQNRHQSVLQ